MARTRLYIDWLFPRRIHPTDYLHSGVFASVLRHRAGRGKSVVQADLLAVVLVSGVLQKP